MSTCATVGQVLGSSLLQLLGVALLTAAVVTPNWLVVLEPSTDQYHHHGLWQDCTQAVAVDDRGRQHLLPQGEYKCIYKEWPEPGVSLFGDELLHKWNNWQVAVLALATTAIFLGIANTVLGCCAVVSTRLSFAWAISTLLTVVLSAAALGVFSFKAGSFEIKHLVIDSGKPQVQEYGESFWLAIAATVVYCLAALLSLSLAVFRLRSSSGKRSSETWFMPKASNTTV